MGQLHNFIAQVLGLDGWTVVDVHWETPVGIRFVPAGAVSASATSVIVVGVGRRWMGRCSTCAARCSKVHEHTPVRRWIDLPWAGRSVVIEYAPDRLSCSSCQCACVRLLPWADRYQRETAVRQGRGYRNLQFLMLKVRFMVANPIRDDDGVRRFLAPGLPTPYRAAA